MMVNYFGIHANILCIKIVGKMLTKNNNNKNLLKISRFARYVLS